MKSTNKITLLIIGILGLSVFQACKKDAGLAGVPTGATPNATHTAKAPLSGGRTQGLAMLSGVGYEWNGCDGSKLRCYQFPCDCDKRVSGSIAASGLSPEVYMAEKTFQSHVDDGTVNAWYASGEGELVYPWPQQQLEDIKSGLVTFKEFASSPGYIQLVYKDAKTVFDRPNYPGMFK